MVELPPVPRATPLFRLLEQWRQALGLSAVMQRGAGSPEGVVTATSGVLYYRTDGATSTRLYLKETDGGSTGWRAIA